MPCAYRDHFSLQHGQDHEHIVEIEKQLWMVEELAVVDDLLFAQRAEIILAQTAEKEGKGIKGTDCGNEGWRQG